MDLSNVPAVVATVQSLMGLVDQFKSGKDATLTAGEASEIYSQVLAAYQSALVAQSAQHKLKDEVSRLEGELGRMKEFREEMKETYELVSLHTGYVYSYEAEPAHWICCSCYENHRKSILQSKGTIRRDRLWYCPSCKAEMMVSFNHTPASERKARLERG